METETEEGQSPDKGLLMTGAIVGVIVFLVLIAVFFGII